MSFIGVVLAGGRSVRMGQDKSQLTLNGVTMLEHTKNLLLQAGATKVLYSRNQQGATSVADIHPQKGPLSGIHAIAMAQPNDDVMFVPVDMPLLTPKALAHISNEAQQQQESIHFKKHCLPLYLKNSAQVRDTLESILSHSQDYSVRSFCQQIGCKEIEAENDKVTHNSNTIEQWHQATEHLLKF